MSEQTTPYKVISNVANVDMRTASAETLATIKSISNVASLIYSPETAPLVGRINVTNVAMTLEVPADYKPMTGQITLGPNNFQNGQAPLKWLVSGQMFFEPELTAEQLDRGVEAIVVSGQILCPEHLAGVLQSKIKHMSGQIMVIPSDAKIVMGKLTFTDLYLRELKDHSNLVVLGKVMATQVLQPEMLAQKLGQIRVFGKVVCAEENSALVRALQDQPVFGDVTIIPAGYELVERSLVLDAGLLETFSGRKLYCTGLVQFDQDVTPEAVDQAIEKLVATRALVAPGHLRKVLAQKCDLLNTTAVFYSGTLWLIEGEVTLDQSRFEHLTGEATLVVLGELQVDPAISPATLTARLQRVHNLGEVTASAAQLAALQARAGVNEGEWTDSSTTDQSSDEDAFKIGNIAYLQL